MSRFTLYHTITDTLGRVHGHLYALDDGVQRKPTNEPVKSNVDVKKGGESNGSIVRQGESTKRLGQVSPNVASNQGQRQKLREREFEIEQRLQQLAENRRIKRLNIIS